jgi:hypothetical protein
MTIELNPATREALDHDDALIWAVQVVEECGFSVGLHHYAADDLRFFIETDDSLPDDLNEEDFLTRIEFLKVAERLEEEQAETAAAALEEEVAKALDERRRSKVA